ncbi:serine/threonine-protein phosphatase 7 long form homolog [Actinidia eriantha]|uniref:serine/threonine-protein phosphatase 7 long form homolog n=1 Tax=Actinidia eriantha TaxID=165200 RepID=UPI002583E1BC|nr:serine/threonine-protein phosphatase 7 long form homolog [Actinidia eriantha]
MDTVGSPGPIDDTVLTLQSHHRSTWIWEHGGTDALACRRCGTGLYDRELDPRVLQYVLRAGFYGVHRLGPIRLDHALITAFVERWRPETHTFHLPIGEASITLQDVAILLGLPIDGAPITHPQTFVTVQECQDICMQAFGVIPPAEDIDSGRLRMSWLRRTFDVLPEHADDVSVQRHARAYILRLIGGACSWGSAVLAMLYRSMCRATKIGQRQIVGALLLLQIWACERFRRMCPYRVDDHTTGQQPLLIGGLQFPGGPWGARWRSRFRTTTTSTHVVRVYRDQLDRLRPDEFIWRPYDDIMHELPDYCRVASDIWVSRSPLVCFEVVEWHLPDRVCRQFGLRQIIPVAANTSPELHGIDMRGRARTDWTQLHGEYIDHWHHRREYLVVGVIDAAAMRYDDPYMVWYRRITRTLVGNPAHRPTSGYVEIGSTIEIATRYIAAIHDRIDRAIYAYDRPESLQDMYDARDMCSRSLHALREHERIEQPGVPEPPPTIPPVVPAASPAMPPAFLVHPPHSMSSSQQFTQYVGATQTYASYVTPTMPSYMYHISAHDVPSSSRPSSSGIRPRHTTHRHITSPVTYDRCSSFSPVGDDDEFDVYVDPLLASRGQMEIPVSVEGVSQITQVELQRRPEPQPEPEPEPQPQPHRLGTLTHVFSRRPRPSRDRRPPRCGTGGHV